MANHKSAAKRARQSVKREAVNSRRKSTVRTIEKSVLKAVTEKNLSALPELLKKYTSQMAKAAGRGLFKKNMAARKIGRLSTRVQATLGAKK